MERCSLLDVMPSIGGIQLVVMSDVKLGYKSAYVLFFLCNGSDEVTEGVRAKKAAAERARSAFNTREQREPQTIRS